VHRQLAACRTIEASEMVPEAGLDIVWLGEEDVIMTDHPDPQPTRQDSNADSNEDGNAPETSFWSLLYRFLFFDWLFTDVSAARNRIERHAAHQHNRRMCRYLPVYLRRWSCLAAFDYALGMLFERTLQASLLSAWFFTWSCVTLTGMVVITVAWVVLAHARLS
jgi:hypothetical protein